MKKKTIALIATAMAAALFTGCGSANASKEAGNGSDETYEGLTIGAKDFTESLVVAEVYALALEDHGYPVEREYSLANAVIRESIVSGDVDVYPEYTGTSLVGILGMDPIYDPEECYNTVKEEYEKQLNLLYLDSTTVNDSQGLAILKSKAEELNITTVSDAWEHAPELVFSCQAEFLESESGYIPLEKAYGEAEWKDVSVMQHTLSFSAAKAGEVDVFSVYTTEGNLEDEDYIVLEDDKQAYAPYYLAPVARPDALEKNPGAEEIINQVTATFTTANVIEMNAKVDIEHEEYEDVAAEYYETIKDSIGK